MNASQIQTRLVEFLRAETGQSTLDATTDLLEAGATDSLTMMDLLVFIETELGVRLDFADVNPDVFRTAETIARLIQARLADEGRSLAA